ncbi:MAG: nitrile hydratase subunit alpha, partial [Acetobacteraceae bacterium]|nr:nitrile hydratase subunit alpha [Acetobacteraceae bacterium]
MNVQGVDSEKLLEALTRVLRDKGLVDDDDIAERIAATDRGSPEQGARMVARAWTDPDYRALMLQDGS